MSLHQEELTDIEASSIASTWRGFLATGAGKMFQQFLDNLENNALIDLRECVDYSQMASFGIRYQQRAGVVDAIRKYMQSQVEFAIENGEEIENEHQSDSGDTSYS